MAVWGVGFGQKQRLVVAAALACDKKILLFDEPTSGVDYRYMEAIAGLLSELPALGTWSSSRTTPSWLPPV
ncbi:ATP-binding cassette domain-containing protein [Trueperella pecoris]|uniref:ATP-binding cassette domain-containing protein n=1 Tax=Trueperella pecoris TaxID=2733571 RepID=A0A7M1R0N0_9ACTO|nr:ATP-binding cassette domain-containing protein [Trueperella pecoris]